MDSRADTPQRQQPIFGSQPPPRRRRPPGRLELSPNFLARASTQPHEAAVRGFFCPVSVIHTEMNSNLNRLGVPLSDALHPRNGYPRRWRSSQRFPT